MSSTLMPASGKLEGSLVFAAVAKVRRAAAFLFRHAAVKPAGRKRVLETMNLLAMVFSGVEGRRVQLCNGNIRSELESLRLELQ